MNIIEILLIISMLELSFITARSDLKEGLIYNKILRTFGFAGCILDALYYGIFARDLLQTFLINFALIVLIGVLLFYTHSFAGGDCKLSIVLALLYPAGFYLEYGDNRITLFWAIGIAIFYGYVYLLITSIWSIIRKKNRLSLEYVKNYLLSFIKSFISAMIYISGVNLFVIFVFRNGIEINEWIIRILCMGIAWAAGRYRVFQKWYTLVGTLLIDLIFILWFGIIPISVNPENYILVIVLLLCQMTIKTSIYEEIEINDLKKGMILSTVSSMLMQGSRVRGLPSVSSEDLRNRLTSEEIESIQRWGESRKITTVTIIKKIPFAIFLALGFTSYFLWSVQ